MMIHEIACQLEQMTFPKDRYDSSTGYCDNRRGFQLPADRLVDRASAFITFPCFYRFLRTGDRQSTVNLFLHSKPYVMHDTSTLVQSFGHEITRQIVIIG